MNWKQLLTGNCFLVQEVTLPIIMAINEIYLIAWSLITPSLDLDLILMGQGTSMESRAPNFEFTILAKYWQEWGIQSAESLGPNFT